MTDDQIGLKEFLNFLPINLMTYKSPTIGEVGVYYFEKNTRILNGMDLSQKHYRKYFGAPNTVIGNSQAVISNDIFESFVPILPQYRFPS